MILIYIANLEIAFLLPMIYNVRLDFFDRSLLEVLEDVREHRSGYILDILFGF